MHISSLGSPSFDRKRELKSLLKVLAQHSAFPQTMVLSAACPLFGCSSSRAGPTGLPIG